MNILLLYLFGFISLASPLTGCSRSNNGHVYTVAEHQGNLDSIDATITGGRHNAITVAVAKASPAVVGINVTATRTMQVDPFGGMFGNDPFWRQFGFGPRMQKYQVKELGSGFIISPDGYILTNDHVAGEATKIIVTTTDGSQYDAKLVGTDRNSDVSLLKIDGKHLPYLKLGNSDDLAVGEWAIAMGNPFGLFSINDKPTVTVGVVSNTGVNLGLEEGRNYRDMIQTDAAISSGNSGGPLLDANGEVIGMNSVIRSTAQSGNMVGSIGLGFAIPINRIKMVVDHLRAGEKMNHNIGDLGMIYQDVNGDTREYFNLSSDIGVVVTGVNRAGLAQEDGIQPGDLIVGLDNEKIRGSGELDSALADHLVGDTVTFHIERNGKIFNVRMKLPGKQ